MCFATQLTAAGGLDCDWPALGCVGAAVLELLLGGADDADDADEPELDVRGAVVGVDTEDDAPVEEELGSKMVTMPEEGSV